MEFIRTRLPDVLFLRPRIFTDARGFFLGTYRSEMLAAEGIDVEIYDVAVDLHFIATRPPLGNLRRFT